MDDSAGTTFHGYLNGPMLQNIVTINKSVSKLKTGSTSVNEDAEHLTTISNVLKEFKEGFAAFLELPSLGTQPVSMWRDIKYFLCKLEDSISEATAPPYLLLSISSRALRDTAIWILKRTVEDLALCCDLQRVPPNGFAMLEDPIGKVKAYLSSAGHLQDTEQGTLVAPPLQTPVTPKRSPLRSEGMTHKRKLMPIVEIYTRRRTSVPDSKPVKTEKAQSESQIDSQTQLSELPPAATSVSTQPEHPRVTAVSRAASSNVSSRLTNLSSQPEHLLTYARPRIQETSESEDDPVEVSNSTPGEKIATTPVDIKQKEETHSEPAAPSAKRQKEAKNLSAAAYVTRGFLRDVLGGTQEMISQSIVKSRKPLALRHEIAHMTCPISDLNPEAPLVPTTDGNINYGFSAKDRGTFSSPRETAIFVGAKKVKSKWFYRYMGTYRGYNTEFISKEDWRRRSEATKTRHIQRVQAKDERYKANPGESTAARAARIRKDFDSGKLQLPCVKLQFVNFDKGFAKELYDRAKASGDSNVALVEEGLDNGTEDSDNDTDSYPRKKPKLDESPNLSKGKGKSLTYL